MTQPWDRENSRTHERLRAHARRTGADRAAATDPTAHLQYEMLRHLLTMAESALDDEHVDPDTARRVLDRLIYGCTPNPIEVAERKRLVKRLIDHTSLCAQPQRIILDPTLIFDPMEPT
jgi:hypothetical protein